MFVNTRISLCVCSVHSVHCTGYSASSKTKQLLCDAFVSPEGSFIWILCVMRLRRVVAHSMRRCVHGSHEFGSCEMDTHDAAPFSLTVILCIAPYLMQLNAMPFGVRVCEFIDSRMGLRFIVKRIRTNYGESMERVHNVATNRSE